MQNKSGSIISIEGANLYTKFAIASFFMFIIPLIIVLYVALFITPGEFSIDPQIYTSVLVLLTVISGVFGYILIRRIAKRVTAISGAAKLAAEGAPAEKISLTAGGELNDLAAAFNRITSDLEKKIKELEYSRNLTKELFQKIGHAITSTQKIDALLNIIVQSARAVLKAEISFLALYDKKDNLLRFKAYSGNQKGITENMVLPDDKGILGLVIKNARPMMIEKGRSADAALPQGEEKIPYNDILCVPIVQNAKVNGVLAVINKTGEGTIEKDDLSLLENLAVQVATSIRNFELNKDIEDTYYQTLLTLARAVEAKDAYSKDHLEKVAFYVGKMAGRLNLDEESKKTLVGGAMLHDLGKVGIDDKILKKADKLSPEEYEIMKQHCIIGENILRPLRTMDKLSKLVRYHHEMYDGTGYPDGLKGEEIPLLARILTIADIYDAIIRERPYKKASEAVEAVRIIKSYAGNKLDPRLIDIFLDVIKESSADLA